MNAREEAQYRWDHVAKPLHSLGLLEDLIVQIAAAQQTADVRIEKRCALIFCADHGVVAEGVTQTGSEVTALVARSIAEGTASVSHTDVFAVDMGMLRAVPGTIDRRVACGTANIARGPAMTRAQAEQAVQAGIDLVGERKARGYQIVATGEMGIGNTTASAAVACALLGLSPEEATGRGAGLSDAGLARKRNAVARALDINRPRAGVPVVIDGVISAAAALAAARIRPEAREFMLPSHMSREPAALRIMEELHFSPILHADMALGEGAGAVALFPLLDMALCVYRGTHTFDALGIGAYTRQEGTK